MKALGWTMVQRMPLVRHGALDLALVADERRGAAQVGREREIHEGLHAAQARELDERELAVTVDVAQR